MDNLHTETRQIAARLLSDMADTDIRIAAITAAPRSWPPARG